MHVDSRIIMPLPASLFLQRGRSDSMMNVLDDHGNATSPSPTMSTRMQQSQNSAINQGSLEVDASHAPMCIPPITMTAFDSSYGPHGLLASAMSCSYDAPLTQNASHPFNPRPNLLRRTTSSSTLDSSEDEEDVAWSAYDIERLTAVGHSTFSKAQKIDASNIELS